MNTLTKLIKEKFISNNNFTVYYSKYDNEKLYCFTKYFSENNVTEQFIKELEYIWEKPISEKNIAFHCPEMHGFKKTLIQAFIKNESFNDFENAFHSFFKNFGMKELFNIIHITSQNGIIKSGHPYQPYILFLLKQDYRENKDFHSFDFLDALNFNFKQSNNNYSELKESLYLFLDVHYQKAKENYLNYYKSHAKDEKERICEFDLKVYERIKKHIREDDLSAFKSFWNSILIKKSSKDLLSIPEERFLVFDVQYSYLTEHYPSITNSEYAKEASEFISNFINNNFDEYLSVNLLKSDATFSQFVCEFRNRNIKDENMSEIIKETLSVFEDCDFVKNSYLKNEYKELYEKHICDMKRIINLMVLNNELPINNVSDKKFKI